MYYFELFLSNVGRQGYYLDQEFHDQNNFKFEKGTIFSNLFLKNVNKNLGIHDIGIKMNEGLLF